LIRTRIAAAVGAAALATAGSLFAAGTAQASSPGTPYMCPSFLNDGATGLYQWVEGQGVLVCYYNSTGTLYCRYNAYNGAPIENASYCPSRAAPAA
jgi:hypothetical protein